jgi:formamidopyrimidine-DNA glycosylase
MPELPEVETTLRDLRAAGLEGSRILRAEVLRARTVEPLTAEEFCSRTEGGRIDSLRRRGKFLLLRLKNGRCIAAHLRMSGSFSLAAPSAARDPHDRLILSLELPGGAAWPASPSAGRVESREPELRSSESPLQELRFHDPRAFGRVRLLEDEGEVLGELGPEPLDPALDAASFHRLMRRRRQLKPLLLDQRVIAGLGNIYADEVLFEAGLHPLTLASELDREETARLLEAIRRVLRGAIERRGTSLGGGEGNYRSGGRSGENRASLSVYGRTGEPCPRCGTPVERLIVSQRSTHICPRCQSTGRP